MYLPSKGVSHDRALITIGAEVLEILERPLSVSALWAAIPKDRHGRSDSRRVTFDWFSLALAALFTIEAVDWTDEGYLRRADVSP